MSDFQLGWCQISKGEFVEPLWFTPKGRTFKTLGDAIKVADKHNAEFKTIEHCIVDGENSEREWMDEAIAWRAEDSPRRTWEGSWSSYAAERYEKQRKIRLGFSKTNTAKLCPKCRGRRDFEVWPRDSGGAVVGQEWELFDRCEGTGQIIPVSS